MNYYYIINIVAAYYKSGVYMTTQPYNNEANNTVLYGINTLCMTSIKNTLKCWLDPCCSHNIPIIASALKCWIVNTGSVEHRHFQLHYYTYHLLSNLSTLCTTSCSIHSFFLP